MDNQKPVRFDLSFTPAIATYIEECKSNKEKPTIKGFAKRMGCDVHELWAWATKKKKDDKGNLIDELARPNFHAALTDLDILEKEQEKPKPELNTEQELFCQYYATDFEVFANGTQAYIKAYQPDQKAKGWYTGVRASASRLLTDANILKRINELLEMTTLNDAVVDKQLSFVIMQNWDFPSKVAAIREYNKLKSRITEKIDHTSKGKRLPTPIYGGSSKNI